MVFVRVRGRRESQRRCAKRSSRERGRQADRPQAHTQLPGDVCLQRTSLQRSGGTPLEATSGTSARALAAHPVNAAGDARPGSPDLPELELRQGEHGQLTAPWQSEDPTGRRCEAQGVPDAPRAAPGGGAGNVAHREAWKAPGPTKTGHPGAWRGLSGHPRVEEGPGGAGHPELAPLRPQPPSGLASVAAAAHCQGLRCLCLEHLPCTVRAPPWGHCSPANEGSAGTLLLAGEPHQDTSRRGRGLHSTWACVLR